MLDRFADLGVQRLPRRKPDETARLALPFEEGDPMAAQGQGHRGAQPGRAAAGNRHVTGRGGGRERAQPAFLPGRRVQRAADRVPLCDLMEAYVAGNAGPHLAEPAIPHLVGQLRVRDELARHADQVGIALLENPIRVHGVLDPAEGDHRYRSRALERGVQVVEGRAAAPPRAESPSRSC